MKPLDFLTNSDTPKLTDAEAAQLRCVALSVFNHYALQHAGLVTGAIRGRPSRKLTPRGAQALAAYDAEQRRRIRAEVIAECASWARARAWSDHSDGARIAQDITENVKP